jgi:glutathione S-transferase
MTSVRFSEKSVLDRFNKALNAASEQLGDGKYFGGEKPGLLDALIGPDLLLIPFYLPASHHLHQEFSLHHNLYDYSIHMLEHFRHLR